MSLFTIFIFIVILLVLVIIHELGHFLAAKAIGARVDEFAFGFPPKIFSKKIGETTYTLNALPLGGYVKIHGEEGGDEHPHDKRSMASKKWWQQIFVLIAGVSMNMFFAFLVLVSLSLGKAEVYEDDSMYVRATDKKLIVTTVLEKSPALLAGITEGDEILSIKNKSSTLSNLSSSEAVSFIQKSGDEVTITYKNKQEMISTVTLAPVYGVIKDKKAIGVGFMNFGYAKLSLSEAIVKGFHDTISITKQIAVAFKNFFATLLAGKSVADQVAGPVGLVKVVGQAEKLGYGSVALLAAVISINLAFFNILPFPALDGGRAVITLGEAITRRKMNKKVFSNLNAFGFIFLMIVFVLVTVKDIIHLF